MGRKGEREKKVFRGEREGGRLSISNSIRRGAHSPRFPPFPVPPRRIVQSAINLDFPFFFFERQHVGDWKIGGKENKFLFPILFSFSVAAPIHLSKVKAEGEFSENASSVCGGTRAEQR